MTKYKKAPKINSTNNRPNNNLRPKPKTAKQQQKC